MAEDAKYFCPSSCSSVAVAAPRETGCREFGVCEDNDFATGNPSDVRTATGCHYFGGEVAGSCIEVLGAGRMPDCWSWTKEEVGDWIVTVGFPLYQDCFIKNCITGRKLILVNASALPKMGVHDFEHIRIIAKLIRDLLHIEDIPWDRSITLPPREENGMFLELKSIVGPRTDKLSFEKFHDDWPHIKFAPPLCNQGILSSQ